jgi:tripartite-type tricarboxylate transporter receptor subunit TctC
MMLWMIGFPPGGAVDIVARIMGHWLSEHFGQQFLVENRAGSGGNIAVAAAINSPPDGYTPLFVAANNAISASLYKKLPFDFIRDTVPVAGIMRLTNMMVVPTSLPVKTVQEFIDYCKANPGKVSYASSGNGTSLHMSAEFFKALTHVDMIHVPYRGAAIAYPDLISNKVQVMFDNLPSGSRTPRRRGRWSARHNICRSASARSAGRRWVTSGHPIWAARDLISVYLSIHVTKRTAQKSPRFKASQPKLHGAIRLPK